MKSRLPVWLLTSSDIDHIWTKQAKRAQLWRKLVPIPVAPPSRWTPRLQTPAEVWRKNDQSLFRTRFFFLSRLTFQCESFMKLFFFWGKLCVIAVLGGGRKKMERKSHNPEGKLYMRDVFLPFLPTVRPFELNIRLSAVLKDKHLWSCSVFHVGRNGTGPLFKVRDTKKNKKIKKWIRCLTNPRKITALWINWKTCDVAAVRSRRTLLFYSLLSFFTLICSAAFAFLPAVSIFFPFSTSFFWLFQAYLEYSVEPFLFSSPWKLWGPAKTSWLWKTSSFL